MIPVNEPYLSDEEKEYLLACIESGWISSEGPFVRKFEEQFAALHKRKHGIAVSSGSAALEIGVAALGIGKGDEVIMPTFTIISCASAVVRAGGIPVLVDADPQTWNMDVGQIEDLITTRTKVIMPVHIYGLPVDMKPLLRLAEKHGLIILEDAAEAIGQTCAGRICGSFGALSVFSFYPNKHITTGEGGMLLTDDDDLAAKCRKLRNLCFGDENRFVHDGLGWNYRMTNMQAGIGLAQLKRLQHSIERKRQMGRLYHELLSGSSGIQLPVLQTDYAENIFWVFGLLLCEDSQHNASAIRKKLREKGIGSRPFFHPMHQQPVFEKMGLFKNKHYPVAEQLAQRGLYLPSGLTLTDEQIRTVALCIRELLA